MATQRSKRKTIKAKKKHPVWVNFFAFVGGLTVSICLFALFLSSFLKKEDREVAEGDDLRNESAQPINFSDFEHLLAVSHPEDLLRMLLEMQPEDATLNLPAFVEHHRKIIRLAQQILLFKIDEETRVLAVNAKLVAYSKLFNATLTRSSSPLEYADEIKKTLDSYRHDGNRSIRRMAQTGTVGHEMMVSAIQTDEGASVSKLVDHVIELLRQFPEDQVVASNLKSMIDSVDFFNLEFGSQLRDELFGRGNELQGGQGELLILRLSDEIKLKNTKFQQLSVQATTGPRSLTTELLNVALELAADPSSGTSILKELNVFGNWLEQQNEFEFAERLYQQLLDSVDQRQHPEVNHMAKELAEYGLKRSQIVGEKIYIQGSTIGDKPLQQQDLESSIVVILFWTWDGSLEYSKLSQVLREAQKLPLEIQRVKIVVANISASKSIEQANIIRQYPNFYFIDCDRVEESQPSLSEQFPVNIIPRAIIVDAQGHVRKTNIPLSNLNFVLESIVRSPEKFQ